VVPASTIRLDEGIREETTLQRPTQMGVWNMSFLDDSQSRILVFAEPNGSGKSTITKGLPITDNYVNTDEI